MLITDILESDDKECRRARLQQLQASGSADIPQYLRAATSIVSQTFTRHFVTTWQCDTQALRRPEWQEVVGVELAYEELGGAFSNEEAVLLALTRVGDKRNSRLNPENEDEGIGPPWTAVRAEMLRLPRVLCMNNRYHLDAATLVSVPVTAAFPLPDAFTFEVMKNVTVANGACTLAYGHCRHHHRYAIQSLILYRNLHYIAAIRRQDGLWELHNDALVATLHASLAAVKDAHPGWIERFGTYTVEHVAPGTVAAGVEPGMAMPLELVLSSPRWSLRHQPPLAPMPPTIGSSWCSCSSLFLFSPPRAWLAWPASCHNSPFGYPLHTFRATCQAGALVRAVGGTELVTGSRVTRCLRSRYVHQRTLAHASSRVIQLCPARTAADVRSIMCC